MWLWCNSITPAHLNGQNRCCKSWKDITTWPPLPTSNWSPPSRNCWMKKEKMSQLRSSNTKTATIKSYKHKNQWKVWRKIWSNCNLNWNKLLLIPRSKWKKCKRTKQPLMSWRKVSKGRKTRGGYHSSKTREERGSEEKRPPPAKLGLYSWVFL